MNEFNYEGWVKPPIPVKPISATGEYMDSLDETKVSNGTIPSQFVHSSHTTWVPTQLLPSQIFTVGIIN